MNTQNFKKRTEALKIPQEIYDKYNDIVNGCEQCQKFAPAPERSKVSGIRAERFGDLWFVDHVDVTLNKKQYLCLVIIDALSNLLFVEVQKDKLPETTLEAFQRCRFEWKLKPKHICGDQYFESKEFK